MGDMREKANTDTAALTARIMAAEASPNTSDQASAALRDARRTITAMGAAPTPSPERVDFDGDDLDEVFVTGGAHLERLDKKRWFLALKRADGSEFCVWLHGKVSMTEERPPRGLDADQEG